jgi:hypothetical protein
MLRRNNEQNLNIVLDRKCFVYRQNNLSKWKELLHMVSIKLCKLFCQDDVEFDMLLLIRDATPHHILKGAEDFSVSYPKLIHVTYVVHAFHRVCKIIRVQM